MAIDTVERLRGLRTGSLLPGVLTLLATTASPVLALPGVGGAPRGAANPGPRSGGAMRISAPPARGPAPFRAVAPVRMVAPPPARAPMQVAAPAAARAPMQMAAPARTPGFAGAPAGRSAILPPPPAQRPHVERGDRWVGHDSGPRDSRYLGHAPWPHGRFAGGIGRSHPYSLGGWDGGRHRFWSNGVWFDMAESDWGFADDWSWTSDRVILYDDPDHVGWYLAYNVRLGTYIHVEYAGERE